MLSQIFKFHNRRIWKIIGLIVIIALIGAVNPSLAAPSQTPDNLIKTVGFGPKGEWLVLYGLNGYASMGLADTVLTNLGKINDAKEEIQWIAFGPDGAWLLSSANSFFYDKLPTELNTELDRLIKAGSGSAIKFVAFAPNGGWVVIWGTNGYTANNLPKSAVDAIDKLNADGKEIKQLTFDSTGAWVIVYGTNGLIWSDGAAQGLIDQLKKLNDANETIRQVAFSPDDGSGIGWIVLYGKDQVVGKNLPKTFADKMKELEPTLK